MTKQNKPDGQGDALTPEDHETMRIIDDEAEELSAEALSIRAAGGFKNWAVMRRPESIGFNAKKQGRRAVQVQWESIAHSLAYMAYEERLARTPAGWAWAFSEELRANNPSMDKAEQSAAEAQIMRTFEAQADTLPLRQAPSGLRWPKGQPLPPKWREGLYMTKVKLRAWAKEHCPDLLGSALLAEQAPESAPAVEAAAIAEQGTPAEQFENAQGNIPRRAALARAMLKECQDNMTEAARRLGTYRQTIDRVLRKDAVHSAAGVAPMYAQLARKPHKT
ncbi:hypothetical protein [Thiomonas intermedia]|uniref:hypothetical protein n=1 Tax=Thiomonas intermedia TaxID=926 RepID=UPI0009A53724|nr:hypothetical protein [Thiomonas intermedia]